MSERQVRPLKLVVAGPVGAGKTTFIGSLSEMPVVETDELATEAIGKERTTVALDYGKLILDGVPIHLFGTPGQSRFTFMWDVLVEGALGFVLLVAGNQPQDFPQARSVLEYLTSRHPVPFVVGVTRQDLPKVWAPEDVALYFDLPSHQVVGMNATSPTSATLALIRVLELVTGEKWQGVW
jgi:signal recognition particle receptor subunit beta